MHGLFFQDGCHSFAKQDIRTTKKKAESDFPSSKKYEKAYC
jgi:hypothetical protein